MAALAEAGIERTFAIQELTLPLALAGEDVIGQARTGMGKTLGFGVPLLQRVTPPSEQPAANADGEAADRTKDVPQALVVVPTRELCVQVAKDLADAGAKLGVRVTAIYGGRAYEPQLAALRKGVDVVVGTPGRLLDLAEQRHLVLGRVKALVLDEADEMLDLGFLPDVERIMRMLPEQRHTMLFSATMPGPIIALSRAFLNRPTHIRAEEADQGSIHERTTQFVYRAHAMDKVELLTRVLQAKDRGLTMIFARTKRTVQRVADDLADRGFAAAAVHGDLGQGAREQALRAFRSGQGRRAGGHGRRGPRDRRHGRHARRELPVPRRRQDLRAPDRPHRPGRQDRRRGHARRLGRAPPVEDDQRRPRARHAGGPGDVLHLGAPLQRPRHPRDRDAAACRTAQAHPRQAWTPSTSTPRATRADVAAKRPRPRTVPRRPTRRVRARQRRSRARSRGGVLLGSDGAPVDGRADRRRSSDADRGAGAAPRAPVRSTTPARPRRAAVAVGVAPVAGGWPVTPSRCCAVRRRDPGRRGELRPVGGSADAAAATVLRARPRLAAAARAAPSVDVVVAVGLTVAVAVAWTRPLGDVPAPRHGLDARRGSRAPAAGGRGGSGRVHRGVAGGERRDARTGRGRTGRRDR